MRIVADFGRILCVAIVVSTSISMADECRGPCFRGEVLPARPNIQDGGMPSPNPPNYVQLLLGNSECTGWAFDLGPCPIRHWSKEDANWWLQIAKKEVPDDFVLAALRKKLIQQWHLKHLDYDRDDVRPLIKEAMSVLEQRFPTRPVTDSNSSTASTRN